jgi:2-keto-3-deoxy-L-rhamnonate aldolase RhmA
MNLSWQQIPSPIITEIISEHYDGTVLDTEHGCFNNETLYTCIQVLKLQKKQCFVRLKDISKSMIGMCLDAGVDGLIFSTVETKEQCDRIIEYSTFPPVGNRGLGLVRQNMWGLNSLEAHCGAKSNPLSQTILVPQIETKKSVDNLENIISDYFKYYLIGPYDLSLSLDFPGKFDSPRYKCYIDKINNLIPNNKKAIHTPDKSSMSKEQLKYGLRCIGMDTTILIQKYGDLKDVKL